jgi:hypothetical protein
MRVMSRPARPALLALVILTFAPSAVFVPSRANAQERSVIGNPGNHPHYVVDAEPHGLLGFGGPFYGDGFPGVGFRGTFTVVRDGFVRTINNSVGVGVGADFFFGRGGSAVVVPVVMQWNFWLSTHWSVFGEPGIGFTSARDIVTPIFAAGGRYNFTDRIALTMRAGYPSLSVGVSFFL